MGTIREESSHSLLKTPKDFLSARLRLFWLASRFSLFSIFRSASHPAAQPVTVGLPAVPSVFLCRKPSRTKSHSDHHLIVFANIFNTESRLSYDNLSSLVDH